MGNRFILTYAGERYAARAKEILKIKKELDHEMGDIIKNNEGLLNVGFPVMRGTYMLPCTLPIFHSLYPHVKLDIVEANSDLLENMILEGNIDLAFFNLPILNTNISYDVISHEEVLLILSAEHPLTRLGIAKDGCKYLWMDLQLLKDEPFILQEPGQRTRKTVDTLFKNQHFCPRIKLQTSNIHASVELASKHYGICFVTETHLRHVHLERPIACFSVGNPCTTVDFVAAYRKGSYLPYHAKEYIKIVREFT